jgi:hypothetical protein
MRHYTAKKTMYKVAKPIIEVFLSGKSKVEKREVLKKIVGRTKWKKPNQRKWLSRFVSSSVKQNAGEFCPISGDVNITKYKNVADYSGVAVHELAHALASQGIINNDYVLASAFRSHLGQIRSHKIITERGERWSYANGPPSVSSIRKPENLRKLTKLEKMKGEKEYSGGFYCTGTDLGRLAAHIEEQKGIPFSGLMFLKLVDRGIPIEAAERNIMDAKGQRLEIKVPA